MDGILKFLLHVGILKERKRRGWLAHNIPDCETTASHVFRVAIMAWVLGRKRKLNIDKLLKISLIHDICEAFTNDETPYDPLLPLNFNSRKDKQKAEEILKKWPKLSLVQKKKKAEAKYKREKRALAKLLVGAPIYLRKEIQDLWEDFEKGHTREGRFAKQIDKTENFLQGIEYWKKHGKIQKDLWLRWVKEIIDDTVLIDFIKTIEKDIIKKS